MATEAVNWRGGPFRLLLVASVIWIAYTFVWLEICLVPAFLGGGGWWCDDKTFDPTGENLEEFVINPRRPGHHTRARPSNVLDRATALGIAEINACLRVKR